MLQFATRSVRTMWWISARKSLVRWYQRCTHAASTCPMCVHCALLLRSGHAYSWHRRSRNCFPTSACRHVPSARASDAVSTSAFVFRSVTVQLVTCCVQCCDCIDCRCWEQRSARSAFSWWAC